MGLFKEFKDDLSTAVNEMVPGGENLEPVQPEDDLVVLLISRVQSMEISHVTERLSLQEQSTETPALMSSLQMLQRLKVRLLHQAL